MLKIVNQTSIPIGYSVDRGLPTSQHIAEGLLGPNQIAAYRIDNDPQNDTKALNCYIYTYSGEPGKTGTVRLEKINVPGNATVVFSTQIITGLLQPGS
jgi:hypothetical protein